jgi:hypothetical protein
MGIVVPERPAEGASTREHFSMHFCGIFLDKGHSARLAAAMAVEAADELLLALKGLGMEAKGLEG